MTRARSKPKAIKESSRGTITYGDFYRGTRLRRRYERHDYEVAPEYFGDPSLSLCERLLLAFAAADKYKIEAVVVEGVLYPKLNGEWYKWKRPRETYELLLKEMGLSDEEIFFRLHVQQFETAKSDLMAAFKWTMPDDWDESLKFHRAMPQTPEVEEKIIVLEAAIKARSFLEREAG